MPVPYAIDNAKLPKVCQHFVKTGNQIRESNPANKKRDLCHPNGIDDLNDLCREVYPECTMILERTKK